MEENADGPLDGEKAWSLFLSAELGARVRKRRIEKAITQEALLAELSTAGSPISGDELGALESGESIDWAEPGFSLIAALAFLFEVSPSQALQDSDPFAMALAKSANLQRKSLYRATGSTPGCLE